MDILSIATAVPRAHVKQTDAAEFACQRLSTDATERQQNVVRELYRRSGVASRGTVILDETDSHDPKDQLFYQPSNSPNDRGPTTSQRMEMYERSVNGLALRAAAEATRKSGVSTDKIGHLVTVSCTGFGSPGFDFAIINELGLSAETSRTHVGFMGCHGLLNALRVARGYVAQNPNKFVLVCAAELCTLHHQYGFEPEQIVANSLFADGAAALVVGDAGESTGRWRFVDSRSRIVAQTEQAMTWRIGDAGFEMTLSAAVPQTITQYLRPTLEAWLSDSGLTLSDISSVAIHPGGPRILRACAEAAGFTADQMAASESVLREHGNMSSPTVAFILERLIQHDSQPPCVMLGFGPGLTIEYALLK